MLLMVADLCHFVIAFCRCEITIVFVFSPQNNDLTAKLTRNNEINEAKYFAPLFIVFSPRINNTLRLFVISRRTDEITKRRKLPSFCSEKTINTGAKNKPLTYFVITRKFCRYFVIRGENTKPKRRTLSFFSQRQHEMTKWLNSTTIGGDPLRSILP